jgi:hypothetical protein
LIVHAKVEARRRTDDAEVMSLTALPKALPFRIVLPFGIPAGTDLRIDTEVDGNINQIGVVKCIVRKAVMSKT